MEKDHRAYWNDGQTCRSNNITKERRCFEYQPCQTQSKNLPGYSCPDQNHYKEASTNERYSPLLALAPTVHRKPITNFDLENSVGLVESFWNTRRAEEIVRRTTEFTIGGVSFCEFRRNEKTAVKANWDALMRE